jgi:four helix bundle protein
LNFENLEVWKRSARLSADIYKATANLKDYGFRDQLTRSGLSVPSNIAEGMTREGDKEKRRFLDIAYSSLAEVRTQIYIGIEIGYLEAQQGLYWIEETKQLSAMLICLKRKI